MDLSMELFDFRGESEIGVCADFFDVRNSCQDLVVYNHFAKQRLALLHKQFLYKTGNKVLEPKRIKLTKKSSEIIK